MFFTPSNTSFTAIESNFQVFLFENDLKALFPELFLLFSTLFLLFYGVSLSTSQYTIPVETFSSKVMTDSSVHHRVMQGVKIEKNNKKKEQYIKLLKTPLLLQNISFLSLLCLVFAFLLLKNNFLTNALIFYGSLVYDDFTFFMKGLVLCGAFFSIVISLQYLKQESIAFFESILLIMLSICSMLFLICSADFISMYLAIELQSFCFYILAASKRNSEFSTEAGLKYFLLGAFSSGLLLFGCSFIYGFTGITTFSELAKFLHCGASEFLGNTSSLRGCELGMIFLMVGFLFKLTAAPFHMWAPDVYEGAPTYVTAFFSIVPKVSILAVFLKVILDCFFDFMLPWQKIFWFSSVLSMVVGALAAFSQSRIKRFLAFSSIGHVGYLLIGFCCGTMEGLQSLLVYLVVYVIMTLTLFAIVLSPVEKNVFFIKQKPNAEKVQRVKYISDFAFLGKTNAMLALTLTVTMFSIAGIPPLAGFYSKAAVFFAAMSSGMYFLAAIGVLTSVCSCFYYIRLVKIMYFENPKMKLHGLVLSLPSFFIQSLSKKKSTLKNTRVSINKVYAGGASSQIFSQISKENSITLGLAFLFLLFFLLYPSPLFLATHKIALSLCV